MCVLYSLLLTLSSCGQKQDEFDEDESALDLEESFNDFERGHTDALTLIQGERIFGAATNGNDTTTVTADIEGNGTEWDVTCVTSNAGVTLHARREAAKLDFPAPDGLPKNGRIESPNRLELGVLPLNQERTTLILCAIGDNASSAILNVYRCVGRRIVRVAVLEGESYFKITGDNGVEAPFGSRGLSRRWTWNGTAFDEQHDGGI